MFHGWIVLDTNCGRPGHFEGCPQVPGSTEVFTFDPLAGGDRVCDGLETPANVAVLGGWQRLQARVEKSAEWNTAASLFRSPTTAFLASAARIDKKELARGDGRSGDGARR